MIPALYPYQVEGSRWLAGRRRALLADVMGLGKSAQVIGACDRQALSRILIVCPASTRINWAREFQRWSFFDHPVVVLDSSSECRRSGAVVAICSYDFAHRHLDQLVHDETWDVLVLDESHMLKGAATARTRAVLGRHGLIHHAQRIWALSGTPAPNHPGELWPLLFTLGATALPYAAFIERYCTGYPGPHGFRITGARSENSSELAASIAGFSLRRHKETVLPQLPPVHFTEVVVSPGFVELDRARPTSRDQVEYLTMLDRERGLVRGHLDAHGMKGLEALARSVSTLRRYTGLQKIEPVVELLHEELGLGLYEKLVLFALHRDVIEELQTRLRRWNPVVLRGDSSPRERQDAIDRFQDDPRSHLFIGNILVAGTGINLTVAHQVLFVEQDWVPGNNQQAAMRCHRIGQTRPVMVRFVMLPDSIDSCIVQALTRKARELAHILGDEPPKEAIAGGHVRRGGLRDK